MESISAAQDWLNRLQPEQESLRAGAGISTSSTRAVLKVLGNPDKTFRYRIIVGGSAGKGGVVRLVESVLTQRGKTTATITSPHLQSITERIRINTKLISLQDWADAILQVRAASEINNVSLTYYEANILAGILCAAKYEVEYLILEVGLGGDFDATHAVQGPRVSAVTFVGTDHRHIFKTAENTAYAKAGIFDTPDLVAAFSAEKVYQDVFQSRSLLPIKWIKGVPSKMNKKIAREICEFILGDGDFVMEKIQVPARWEKIPHTNIILDGAHSESRFDYILPRLTKVNGKKIGVLGLKQKSDIEILRKIVPVFDEVIFTSIQADRSSRTLHSAKALYEYFGVGQYAEDPAQALKMAQEFDGKIIVMGSLYLCGAMRNLFYPAEKITEQQTEFPIV